MTKSLTSLQEISEEKLLKLPKEELIKTIKFYARALDGKNESIRLLDIEIKELGGSND